MTVKPTKRTAEPRPALTGQQQRAADVLWNAAPPPRRGPKAALSAELIARAAIAVADAEGLGAVSMNRIADGFGFTTMSLYRYVAGKTELVDLMFDIAMGPPPDLAAVEGGWRGRLAAWARAMWSVVAEHPWSLEVLMRLRVPGPNELAWMEHGVRALTETGLGGAAMLDSLFLIVGQIRIVAQYALVTPSSSAGGGLTTAQWSGAVAQLLAEHPEDFPALAAATSAGAFAPTDDPLLFGLERVLDGIGLLVARSTRSTGGAKAPRAKSARGATPARAARR